MNGEALKYTIWAADAGRAAAFYTGCFGGRIVRQNPHITEIAIASGTIAIHGGGEGKMCEDTDGNQFMLSRKRG